MAIIKNVRVFNGEVFTPVTAVEFEDGIITNMYEKCDSPDALDGNGCILAPGFVDTHIHGSFGRDVLTPGGTDFLADNLPKVGTTSYCPTNATDTLENINHFLGEVSEAKKRDHGTRVLGAHIEGPFFGLDNRGSHAIPLLKDPTMDNYKKMTGQYEDAIVRFSVAPEKEGAMELIPYLVKKGIVVSAAHTDSTAPIMEEAIAKGVTISTHTFNGFYPFHHRNECSIGVVLTDDRITCEFIPDLQHINKYAARLIMKAKGFEKTFLCSDSLEPGQMPDGDYQLAGSKVVVKNHIARLAEDGRLAGSTISILDGVRNLVFKVGIPLDKALRMGTENAANSINRLDIGRIKIGCKADFILLDDDLDLRMTVIRGNTEYTA